MLLKRREFSGFLRLRQVYSSSCPGVATQDPPKPFGETFEGTVFLNGLLSVFGAAGAVRAKSMGKGSFQKGMIRGESLLINLNNENEGAFYHTPMLLGDCFTPL